MKKGVAILGATGAVGQQFVRFLCDNPKFEIECLTASLKSVGKRYSEVAKWYAEFSPRGMPQNVRDMIVQETSVESINQADNIDLVFSALPDEQSKEIEPQLAREGKIVISKSSAFRMDPLVPLIISEVNPDHLDLLEVQRKNKGWKGGIVADPNCTTSGLVLSLKPILDSVGIKRVLVATWQATSGAGYLGLSPVAIHENIIPFIEGEERKTETEPLKILGKFDGSEIQNAEFKTSAICNRAYWEYGHLEHVFIETKESCDPEHIKDIMKKFKGEPQELELHSAPKQPIIVVEGVDRPQPKLDVNAGEPPGMSVVIGRVGTIGVFENGIKYTLLVHNTVRGGAGMAVLNAELLAAKGFFGKAM